MAVVVTRAAAVAVVSVSVSVSASVSVVVFVAHQYVAKTGNNTMMDSDEPLVQILIANGLYNHQHASMRFFVVAEFALAFALVGIVFFE